MKHIKHHLNDGLLMAYSAGSLPEAFNVVVAAHISLCDECRARLGAFEAVGGAILEQPAEISDEVDFEATMRLINSRSNEPVIVNPTRAPSVFPKVVHDYIGEDLEAVKWRPLGMGVRQVILPTSKDATVRLLRIPAGSAVPDHGHRGTELTLVLQGAFRDEQDRFGPGDIEVADEELEHTPIAEEGEDCICLAATDAPLRFRGIVPRIAQPFLRI